MRNKSYVFVLVFICFLCFICIFCFAFETLNKSQTQDYKPFDNPIDSFFVSCMNNSTCEAETREYQEYYYTAWKKEFENVIQWMDDKFLYESDKSVLSDYVSDVEKLIESTEIIIFLTSTEAYKYEPDSLDRYNFGNSTLAYIFELQAGIYRDACRPLITTERGAYEYLSLEHSLADNIFIDTDYFLKVFDQYREKNSANEEILMKKKVQILALTLLCFTCIFCLAFKALTNKSKT